MSKLKKLSLLFLLLSTGCVIQNIAPTNPVNKESNSNNNLNQKNNFDVLTEEVTAIPTKKPWTLELPSPTPVPPNNPVTGSAFVDLNITGFTRPENNFRISTDSQSLTAQYNQYYTINRKERKIGLADGLAINFSFGESYTLPPEPHNPTRERNVNHGFNGKALLELENNNSSLTLRVKESATASITNSQLRWGGADCAYSGSVTSSLIPSGKLDYIKGKLYGNLTYKASNSYFATQNGCSGQGPIVQGLITGNASVNFSVNIPKQPPVDIQVKVDDINGKSNQIISPANQDKKYDKADLLITTMDYDEWVLIAEGKDVYGNTRRYMEEGKGNKDIEFKGKTNDASNAENDMYFADGVIQITLTSKKSGEASGSSLYVDNTPPEVKVNSVSIKGTNALIDGVVVDKFPENEKLTKTDSAVSGLDETTIPRNFTIEGISVNKESEENYRVTFSDEITNNFIDNSEGLNQIAKYSLLSGIYEKTGDKVDNIDMCESKRNKLYLFEQLISQQKILSDQLEEKILEESGKTEPKYPAIDSWRFQQEKYQVRIDILIDKHEALYKESEKNCKIKAEN